MRLLSLFGLDDRVRRLRIAAAEGALAAEDRVQLLRMAWEDEKQRLKLMLVFVVAVLGLTAVAVALLSMAVVVHFWETPYRITAAWSVAGVWILLWLAAVLGLVLTFRNASNSFIPTRHTSNATGPGSRTVSASARIRSRTERHRVPSGRRRARHCSHAWSVSASASRRCRAGAKRSRPAPPREPVHHRPTSRPLPRHCGSRVPIRWLPVSSPRPPWR